MSNLIVKNGLLIDGTGAAARPADVRIRDGLVTEVGPDLAPDGEEVVDAKGAYVCPGFIDSHTHLDPSMFWDPGCDPMPQHGVTTALIGNCSLSLAPVKPEHLDEVMDVFCLHRGHAHRGLPSRGSRGTGRPGASTATR